VTEPFWERNLLLRVRSGSRAYGLDTPQSDVDSRGVCVPPRRFLLGLSTFEQHESEGGDHVVYALAKFARLALEGNPNLIETLFTEPPDILHLHPLGERLFEARRLFLSRRVGQRFGGYATAQLKRMAGHHRWLNDPPLHQPGPAEFGAREHEGGFRFPDTHAERSYQAALKHWNHYQTWRRQRNPARAALEERHGYDTKHAMHLVRLLRMGTEILTDGEVRVRRPDAEELRAIRAGSLRYEDLLEMARREDARIAELEARSPLPEQPDAEAIETLIEEIQTEFLFGTDDSCTRPSAP
jgi:hypothetical protein